MGVDCTMLREKPGKLCDFLLALTLTTHSFSTIIMVVKLYKRKEMT